MGIRLLYNYPEMGDVFSSLRARYQGYLSSTCHNTGREQGKERGIFSQSGASLDSFRILRQGAMLCVPRVTASRELALIFARLLHLAYYMSTKLSL